MRTKEDLQNKTNKKYMVVHIGCTECRAPSYPIGIYNTLEEAKKLEVFGTGWMDTDMVTFGL